jgi:hypothetical protein
MSHVLVAVMLSLSLFGGFDGFERAEVADFSHVHVEKFGKMTFESFHDGSERVTTELFCWCGYVMSTSVQVMCPTTGGCDAAVNGRRRAARR